mgnify:CR=1 FL=1
MTREIDPCAMCERFTIAGYDKQAAGGMGRCTGFDNDGEPEKFVPASATPACVLFNPAANRAQRRRFLEQCNATEQMKEAA